MCRKDPRMHGAVSALNRLGMLMVVQTALSFIINIILAVVCAGTGYNIYNDPMGMVIVSIGMTPICTGLPALIYMMVGNKKWSFYLRFEQANFFGCLLVVLAGLGICLAGNFPAALLDEFLKDMGMREVPNVLGQGGGWKNFITEFLGVAVLVPIMEEFAFRGVILSGLRRYGTGFAVVGSAIIFGMAHMSASSVVFATIAGLAMGAAYVITGNLWVTVSIHALNNGISIVESYSHLFIGTEQGQQMLSGVLALVVCVAAILSLALLLPLRRKLFPKREPMLPEDGVLYEPLHFGESAAAIVKSPVMWAILSMVVAETAMMFL